MPFQVSPITTNDIPRMIEIEFAAYAANPEAILLRGRDSSNPAHIERAQKRYTHMLTEDPNMTFLKAANENGETVGWIRWEMVPSLDHSRDPAADFDAWPIEGDIDMLRAYWSSYELERREFMGSRSHCYLANLVVDPAYQRRGIARLLMSGFVEAVDAMGLPAYLDSSPQGRSLYESFGFVWQREGVFDMSLYGSGTGVRTHSIMIRES